MLYNPYFFSNFAAEFRTTCRGDLGLLYEVYKGK